MNTCAGWLWLILCVCVRQVPAGEQPPSGDGGTVLAGPKELSVKDFRFNGIYGSDGAQVSRLSTNRFRVTLQAGPGHKNWPNVLQFEITGNGKGNDLRLDVVFPGSMEYPFNGDFTGLSYDRKRWTAVLMIAIGLLAAGGG